MRDGAIDKDKNGSGGIDMALDLSCSTTPVECVLVKMAGVGEPRCVDNANLGKMVSLHTMFEIRDTHRCAALTRKFVNAGRVGPTLVVRTTLLVGVVQGMEVVVMEVVAVKDIGDEFQD